MINKEAITDFNFAFNFGATGFYIIAASHTMQKQVAGSLMNDQVAIYDYSGKEDRFLPADIFYFIEKNQEKEVFFILNFQIPFLGKPPDTQQPDYFSLNLCRDVLHAYHKKIFFFTTKEIEHNISIAAMDFFDYCAPRIVFEDEKKNEVKQQIKNINKNIDSINHKAEIEYRLNLYKDKIDEYLNIDINKYSTVFIENKKELSQKDSKDKTYLLKAARDLLYFARLCDKIGNIDKALILNFKALEIREKILGYEHLETVVSYSSIGYCYVLMGNNSEALDYFMNALKISEKILEEEHIETATMYDNIGVCYEGQKDYSNALEFCMKGLKIRETILGKNHPDTAFSFNNIGSIYFSKGDYSKSLEYVQKSLEIREKVLKKNHPDIARSYYNIGVAYDEQGDYSKALEYYQKALKIQEKALGLDHPDTVDTINMIKEIESKK